MEVSRVTYDGLSQNGLSVKLWEDCPIQSILMDPAVGVRFYDDFMELTASRYTATQATTGTFALDATQHYGVALADSNSATAAQGINVQSTLGNAFLPGTTGKTLWFEARVKVADVATGPEFFLGLCEIDTTIIASSAFSAANAIGWQSVTDDNVILFHGEKATAADSNTATTLVDDTWIKLGFKVYESGGVTIASQWIDGVQQASTTDLAAANIPVLAVYPSLVCQSGGTTDPILHIDWWQCVQLR